MTRKQKQYHFIYKTTNLLSGKYYIGMHSTDNLEDGYLGSGNLISRAIKKHGKENFIREILEFCSSREELKQRESEIVTLSEIAKKECMNLVVGGQGGFISLGGTKKGRSITDNILREKYGDNFRYIIMKNYYNNLTETKKIELKDNIKRGLKKIGYKNDHFKDKTHSKETKEKMSEAKKGKYVGINHPQYGMCWITKDNNNKKINKSDLFNYENEGWVKGRKMK